jgi:hypothetical protein
MLKEMIFYYCTHCMLNFSVEPAASMAKICCPICKDDRDVQVDGEGTVLWNAQGRGANSEVHVK